MRWPKSQLRSSTPNIYLRVTSQATHCAGALATEMYSTAKSHRAHQVSMALGEKGHANGIPRLLFLVLEGSQMRRHFAPESPPVHGMPRARKRAGKRQSGVAWHALRTWSDFRNCAAHTILWHAQKAFYSYIPC